jgi:hypothetical protein
MDEVSSHVRLDTWMYSSPLSGKSVVVSYLDPAVKHLFVPICFALAQSISAQSATQDINRLLAIWGQD